MRTVGDNPCDDFDYLAERVANGQVGFSSVGDDNSDFAVCGNCGVRHEVPGLSKNRNTSESPSIRGGIPILGRNWEVWICGSCKLDPDCIERLKLDDLTVVDGRLRVFRGGM